jgi:hypothetical protein
MGTSAHDRLRRSCTRVLACAGNFPSTFLMAMRRFCGYLILSLPSAETPRNVYRLGLLTSGI